MSDLMEPFPSLGTASQARLNSVDEGRLIKLIGDWLGPVSPESPTGMGDDCAVLQPLSSRHKQLLTTDSLSFGQHFDQTASARAAGAKLIKRNLSDIAAMGGEPGPALLNLLCGPDLSVGWLEQFVDGIRETCKSYGVTIVGGDISQLEAGQFTASLTLIGHTGNNPALRSTATIGDAIYVTGTLGGSIRGKHLDFEPRMQEGRWLAAQDACSAMMDLTDGLGKDLAALLPVEASAAVNLSTLPISADARRCACDDGKSAEEHAFCDGEDYELLFTVARGTDSEGFEARWNENFPALKLTRVGQIVAAHPAGRYIEATSREPLPWQSGFEHFRT